MNPSTTPAPAKKPRKQRADAGKSRGAKFEYYVLNGSTPCFIDRSGVLDRRPILAPCKAGEALEIIGCGPARGPKGRMDTMVKRTLDVVKRVGGATIFEKTERMKTALARYAGLSGDWSLAKRSVGAAG
jgi:hypothetical protein